MRCDSVNDLEWVAWTFVSYKIAIQTRKGNDELQGGNRMIHFKKLAAITTTANALSAVFVPMEAHAYTNSEIRFILQIGTEEDINTAVTERDILNSMYF